MSLGWLLNAPNCNVKMSRMCGNLQSNTRLHRRQPIHYSLPYFSEGPDKNAVLARDEPRHQNSSSELLRLKKLRPELLQQSETALNSVPIGCSAAPR